MAANGNLVPSGLGLRPERMHDDFWFGFVFFCFLSFPLLFLFAPLSLPSLGSLLSSLPHQLDIEMPVWFFELCVAAFFFSFLFFLPSVWSCRSVFLLVHHLDIS